MWARGAQTALAETAKANTESGTEPDAWGSPPRSQGFEDGPAAGLDGVPAYAELHAISNFTFLRGASHPEELVERAHALGYGALALTDECSMAGMVRAHMAAKSCGLHLIPGAELVLLDGTRLLVLVQAEAGYRALCALISVARRAASKGHYRLERGQLENTLPDCVLIWLPERAAQGVKRGLDAELARWLGAYFPRRSWLGAAALMQGDDAAWLDGLQRWASDHGLPVVACGDVHMHDPERQALQDVLTAIRMNCPVQRLGQALFPNAERHLRSRQRLARLYPAAWLAATQQIAASCRFSLDSLRYAYPREVVPVGQTPAAHLRQLVAQGAARRYPHGVAAQHQTQLEHEMALIEELGYEAYFLTVYDIVVYARQRGILCQGRGSAANSLVCYCLGITEVNPERAHLLFGRFISRERQEPPDIDVDFEHERREEVIQYIYQKYGRERAALAAAVITYRPRSAMRDVGKALGFDPDLVGRLAKSHAWWDGRHIRPERLPEAGLSPDHPMAGHLLRLVGTLIGFPRHLSQHVGGFVISDQVLTHWVPLENAAMPGRTIIQWDKRDLENMGLMKVDVLALGMLSALRRSLDLWSQAEGAPRTLADIPDGDAATFAMIRRADTVGVFQIESRAQMAMLPRSRPEHYYDLVVQVAIVRPGPIQGGMVHPYLRRKQGLEVVDYPPGLQHVLRRTYGVPIFQEQVMQIAMDGAGFTAGEADALRRAMGDWQRGGNLAVFEQRLRDGLHQRGYAPEFIERIVRQMHGFGEYGFPESHAASFALLAYASAWFKCHHPALFVCALLNSLPMGFYGPAQLLQDARRHGVVVRPADVNHSALEAVLEYDPPHAAPEASKPEASSPEASRLRAPPSPVVRLGLGMAKGVAASTIAALLAGRVDGPYRNLADLAARTGLSRAALRPLAIAGALASLHPERRQALWAVAGLDAMTPLLRGARPVELEQPDLPGLSEGQSISLDYATQGFSLGRHPLALLRARLDRLRMITARQLAGCATQTLVRVTGIVTGRQRPGTASGVMFVSLEDETGSIQVVVWQRVQQRWRRPLLSSRLLTVHGVLERDGAVCHVVAQYLEDRSAWLGELQVRSRDFH